MGALPFLPPMDGQLLAGVAFVAVFGASGLAIPVYLIKQDRKLLQRHATDAVLLCLGRYVRPCACRGRLPHERNELPS
jgi:hypothetical protein